MPISRRMVVIGAAGLLTSRSPAVSQVIMQNWAVSSIIKFPVEITVNGHTNIEKIHWAFIPVKLVHVSSSGLSRQVIGPIFNAGGANDPIGPWSPITIRVETGPQFHFGYERFGPGISGQPGMYEADNVQREGQFGRPSSLSFGFRDHNNNVETWIDVSFSYLSDTPL